ncbi:MAG: serine/threonine protein kinase [Bdellovibrionales bacterium]|nr:serine/threonine protein kinase [Bdellovibrionales bacterium]
MIAPFEFEKFGKYILVKKIAMGGMAEIFLAKTEKKEGVSQFVVIKRILPQFSSNKKFRTMFKHEGKITSHLRHTNMVYHHEFGVERGVYYIVMEHISGCSLKELVNKSKKSGHKFPTPIAVNIVRSIASALHYIHNSIDPETGQLLSLIHRDVTPHNVMISFNGDIKLIDFGIAKVSGIDLTSSGVVKGKFSYMSPEQISGAKIDHKSDIFSLGVVLWELLAGKKLFSGTNIQSVFGKIRDCRLPNISHIRSGISPDLVMILKKMLEKNPSTRYQQADSIERDLHLFLNKKYPNFSQVDFQNFVKKLYENEIMKERKLMVNISKEVGHFDLKASHSHKSGGQFTHIPVAEEGGPDLLTDEKENQLNNQSQVSQTADSSPLQDTKKKTAPTLKGDPTVVDSGAPISYAKTQLSKNGFMDPENWDAFETHKVEALEDTGASRPASSWDSLKEVYSKSQDKNKTRFFRTAVIISLFVISAWYLLFTHNPIIPTADLLKGKGDAIKQALEVKKTLPVAEDPLEEELPVSEAAEMPARHDEPHRNLAMNKVSEFFNVYIETSPSGANVYLNGDKVGRQTPVLISVPKAGTHHLEVRRDGYEPYILNNLSSSSNVEVRLKKIKKKKRKRIIN